MPPDYESMLAEIRNSAESPASAMKRIEATMRAPAMVAPQVQAGAQRAPLGGGYSAGLGVGHGPLSAGLISASDPQSGQPVMVGGRVNAGPLGYTYVQPTMRGAPATHSVSLGGKPFDADTYFGVQAQHGAGGTNYGVNVARGNAFLSGSYNPQQRGVNVMGGMQRNFDQGGPVTARRLGALIQPPEEQGAVSPSWEGVGEGAQAVASGVGPALQSAGEYIAQMPGTQMLRDVGTLGSHIYEAAKENPSEFIGGMLPGVGNAYALKDVNELSDKIRAAREAGNEPLAQQLEKFAPLAAMGAIMPVGAGAATGAVLKGAERAALKGAEKGAVKGVVEGVERGAVEGAERAVTEMSFAQPKPVDVAFNDVPAPEVLRTDMIGEIERSIADTDGAAAKLPTTMGLGPMYVVDSGLTGLKKKDGFLLNETKNANAERQLAGIEPLIQKYPDMAMNPDVWAKAMAEATGQQNVVAPPYRFAKAMQNGEYEELLRGLTEGQIKDADAGFANGKKFKDAYTYGMMDVADTGKLFMWGILSRGVDPFTHEGLFLDAFNGIEPWVKMAAEGKFTKEVAEGPYKEWAASTAPKGSGQAGAGAMHNLNAFGKDFLVKMGTPNAEGVTPLQKLHDLMANPELTGRDIRREFAKTGEGVGIDNKVVSFILLATGRDDVMVIDRIQLKNLWDDGRFGDVNIWDGISVPVVKTKDGVKRFAPTEDGRAAAKDFASKNNAKVENAAVTGSSLAEATYGAKGILVYEAIEDALMKNVGALYEKLGRPQAASPGRFHWETWVARSNQEASHGTLGSILAKREGAEDPLSGVYSKQGDYQTFAYGSKYGVSPEGPYYMYPLSTGEEVKLSPQQLASVLENVKNPKYGVIPKGFKVSETTGGPWYEREGVNRAKLDELINAAAASGQAGPIRRALGGSVSDGAGRAERGSLAGHIHAIHGKHLNQLALSRVIKRVAGKGTPAEWAHALAGHLISGNMSKLEEHAKKYPKIMRVIEDVAEDLRNG